MPNEEGQTEDNQDIAFHPRELTRNELHIGSLVPGQKGPNISGRSVLPGPASRFP